MSYSGKASTTATHRAAGQSGPEGALLGSDLLLKFERGGVGRIRRQDLAENIARLGQAACFNETARERDAQVVRVKRGDTTAKEGDRRIGVAKLARRLRGERVVRRDRREQSDGLLLALDRALVVAERELHPCEAIEGVGVLWVGGDGAAHRLGRGVARAGLVLFREL